jgi:hypothetical protein
VRKWEVGKQKEAGSGKQTRLFRKAGFLCLDDGAELAIDIVCASLDTFIGPEFSYS